MIKRTIKRSRKWSSWWLQVFLIAAILCSIAAMIFPMLGTVVGEHEPVDSNFPSLAKALRLYREVSKLPQQPEKWYGAFPQAAIYDKQGRALLSWRVAILHHLGEEQLYKPFHFDEPWDSPHNLDLAKKMPSVFRSSSKDNGTTTRFLAVAGQRTAFPPDPKTTIKTIPDGEENTIFLVEVGENMAVPWTKPDEFVVDPARPKKGLGWPRRSYSFHNGYYNVVFGDGQVRPISADIADAVLYGAFTRDGGEEIKPLE